jgi:hypothetical protein
MEYIRDHMGRMMGTVRQDGSKTTVRDFKTGMIVATYDAKSDRTQDWKNNRTLNGNQAIRFLK